jgi:hypothetical protein
MAKLENFIKIKFRRFKEIKIYPLIYPEKLSITIHTFFKAAIYNKKCPPE